MTWGIIGVVSLLSVVMSMWNMSSPQGLWMTMNQFQLILLILLTGAFIPHIVVDYLSSLKASTWSFNFIPFKDIPGFDAFIEWLDTELDLPELDHFGLISGSAFVKNFSLICIIVILIGITLIFLVAYKNWKPSEAKSAKTSKVFEKLRGVFLLDIYLRFVFQANQFLVLSCWAEFYELRVDSISGLVSFIFSICLLAFSMGFNMFAALMVLRDIGKVLPL